MTGKQLNSNSIPQVITSCYLFLMITAFLFYTGAHGFQGIADTKYASFLAICGGYVFCMLLVIGEMALIGKCRLPSCKTLLSGSTWVQRLMALYLAVTWISALLSPHFPVTVIGATRYEGAVTITIYVLVFLLVSVYGRIRDWMLPVFAASVSIFDVLCILQLYGLNPFTLYPEGYDYFGANVHYSGAYLGTIGNVDLVAGFLCIAIPVFWVCLIHCRDKRKWFLTIPLALSLFVLLKMWVLAGLVGVFVGGAIAFCAILPAAKKTRALLWSLLVAGAAAALVLLFFVDAGSGLFHELHLLLRGQAEDTFGSGRIHIWRSVLEQLPEHFWFGTGPDTMALAGLEPFERYDARLDLLLVAEIDLAHNDYLNILFHQGIFAFVIYLAALLTAAKSWLCSAPRHTVCAAAGSAVLCYCVQLFFGFSLCMVAPYFWIMLAFLHTDTPRDQQYGGTDHAKKIT